MRIYQRTLSTWVQFTGTGLHTGLPSYARILPAGPDTGIVFRRLDNGATIRASVENVVETAFATVLSEGGERISTVEHFMAALYGMEIDNAVVEVDSPELPILDGSALRIAEAIDFVGTVESPVRRRFLWVSRNEKLHRNGSVIAVAPSENLEILATVDFPGTLIGKQWLKFTLTPENFLKEIAPSRTFVLREQIEALWASGMAMGGTLENAIVVEGDKVHNVEGLRFQDEFVRPSGARILPRGSPRPYGEPMPDGIPCRTRRSPRRGAFGASRGARSPLGYRLGRSRPVPFRLPEAGLRKGFYRSRLRSDSNKSSLRNRSSRSS
jgi:UDP-3-O-[3-hydroxymyristoyl] N-acetylglucosamine deacetylase